MACYVSFMKHWCSRLSKAAPKKGQGSSLTKTIETYARRLVAIGTRVAVPAIRSKERKLGFGFEARIERAGEDLAGTIGPGLDRLGRDTEDVAGLLV